MTNTPPPLPADFAEMAENMNRDQLKAHYHASSWTIRRWIGEAGVVTVQRVPFTEDEKDMVKRLAKTRTTRQIATHLGRSPGTIVKYCKRNGIVPKPANHTAFNKPAMKVAKRSKLDLMMSDLAGHDRCAVYRCTADGKPSAKGNMIMYGRAIKSREQIEEKCRRKGLIA
ncbi:MAG: hypothetical protein ABJP02_04990 [Parasphingorhabdus sp.]|uniref:helix-turn-helix transcriptional regulator n=1 Tax=Parasphingorhabdus sp. TaxID=2709688 RepID=UPI0032968685